MYFKREHVEQCNRMKRKLRTEQSYQKPETKSVTIETVSELQERFEMEGTNIENRVFLIFLPF